MPATLATVASILKEIYEPRIRKQLNDDAVTLRRIESSSEGVESTAGGRYVTFGIKTRRNQGLGARNESEALPKSGQQGFAAARVGLKYLYGAISITGQTIELANENYQAFTSGLDSEVEGLKDDLSKDLNRMVYGDGTGTLATITADAANSITVASTQYLQLGEMVDIYAADLVTLRAANRQLTAINTTTGVCTYDGADASAPVVATDIVVRTGSISREWTGLTKIVSNTGALYNVDPAVEPVWKSSVDTSGANRALSEGLMINMVDNIRTQGGKTTVIFQNLGVRRAYYNLLVAQRQFVNTKEFTGGFTGLAFVTDSGEIPIVVDIDAPFNKQFFLNEKEITLYRHKDWSWLDRDGSMWQRKIDTNGTYDAYEAYMHQYSEIGCHRRNSQGYIDKLTEA
jgi:hypothetical protein